MPRLPLTELKAASSECSVPWVGNAKQTWHIPDAGKRHLTAIKVDYGTSLFKEIDAKQTCALTGREYTRNA